MENINKFHKEKVEYTSLENLCIDKFWLMPSTPKYVNEGIAYLTSKNIKNNSIDFKNVSYISKEDYEIISANRQIKKGDILITMIGTIGECAIVKNDIAFYGQNMYLLRLDNEKINNLYFYYYFSNPNLKSKIIYKKNTSNQGYIKAESIYNLQVPLPPLEIQKDIANKLDKFTEYISLLNEEFSLRQKQYEYYRDKFLTFGDEVKWVEIGELLDYFQPNKYIVKDINYSDTYDIPVLTAGQTFILGYTNEKEDIYKASKENSVIIFDDFTASFHWVDFDFKVKSSAMKMIVPRKDKDINFRYIYHFMKKLNYLSDKHSRLWISVYSKFKIPLPSLEVQEEIVKILDKFDTLCNSLTEGLPYEIELRQKQYEYYRDLLFNFKI